MKKSFNERCYEILRKVPRGRVITYKEIAQVLGSRAYRAVGNAMNKNPYAPEVACHRVVSSGGRLGGFASGEKNKIRMLKEEGVLVKEGKVLDFDEIVYKF